MSLTANQQTRLEKPATATLFFAEFRFKSGTLRLTNSMTAIQWGGVMWGGIGGSLGTVSPIEESESIEARPMQFELNIADSTLLPLAVGAVSDYRGQPAILYRCPLDDNFRLIDTPEKCWTGTMSLMTVEIDTDGSGRIQLKCETSANGLRRRAVQRLNPAQQKQQYPGDTGLDYLPDLIANPQTWLSVRFQQR